MTVRALLDALIHASISILVLVLFIDGFMTERMGFDRLETLYYLALIAILTARLAIGGTHRGAIIYLMCFMGSIVLGAIIVNPSWMRIADDFRYFVRSILVGWLVFVFYSSQTSISDRRIDRLLPAYWISVCFFVFLHFSVGIGGVTAGDGVRNIYTSYFQSGNVVVFIFLVAWIQMLVRSRRLFGKLLVTLVTALVAVLMSSKALILMLVAISVLIAALRFTGRSAVRRLLLVGAGVLSVVGFLLFWQDLAFFFLTQFAGVAPDGERLLYRLNQIDLVTVLSATRDIKMASMVEAMTNAGNHAWLFGIGAAEDVEGKLLVESDPIDIIRFFGWSGLLLYAFPIVRGYALVTRKYLSRCLHRNDYLFFVSVLASTVLVAFGTGHILTTPAPMIVLGAIFGLVERADLRAMAARAQVQESSGSTRPLPSLEQDR